MMKYIRFSALLGALLLTLSTVGCSAPSNSGISDPAESEQTAPPVQSVPTPFALAIYPEYSLHPVLAANRANLTLSPLLYEPLFQVDDSFHATPILCQSYTVSADNLTWTFQLQPDITFSDGTPFTGEIVADALNLARSSKSRYQQRLTDIRSITHREQSVTITLSTPRSDLPALLDIPIALGDSARPLGTGPYVLEDTNTELSLTARTDWWQNKPLPAQTLALENTSRTDDLILFFDSGDITLVDVDLMGTNALGYSGNYEIWDYSTTDLLYLGFNTQSGLCRDPKLRQAISCAVDRDTAAKRIYAGHAVSTALPVHPNSSWYNYALARQLQFDPEPLAQQVSSLRPANRTLTFVVNNENEAKYALAQQITYQLEAAGLEVTLSALAFEDYTAALESGAFDLYLGEVVLTADFDLSPLLTGTLNYGGWYSEECAALLYSLSTASEATRTQAMDAILTCLCQETPIAPICFKNGSVLTQWGRLSGLSPIRGNVFYRLENWTIS